MKSINYDGWLDKVFERHCTRKDFAVVHIIRDVRGIAAAWKADRHLVVWKKTHGSHVNVTEMHLSDEYDEETCPVNIQRAVDELMRQRSLLYARDLAAVAKFKEEDKCNMTYIQVDGDTYSDNPLGE